MDSQMLRPYIRFAMPVQLHTYKKTVFAYDHRLFYCTENTLYIHCGEAVFSLSPGGLLLLPPAMGYRLECPQGSCRVLLFNFDLDFSCSGTAARPPQPKEHFEKTLLFSPLRMAPFDAPLYTQNAAGLKARLQNICTLLAEKDLFFPNWLQPSCNTFC